MGRGRGTWDARTQGRRDVRLGDSETRGRGTRGRGDVGLGDAGTRRHGDAGTWKRGDAGSQGRVTRGGGDARTWDAGKRRCGTRGRGDGGRAWGGDKQTIPEFCAEFAIYSFWWLNRSLSENSSCKQFQVGTNC